MPITEDKNSKVIIYCTKCFGEGSYEPDDSCIEMVCPDCKGEGKKEIPTREWVEQATLNVKSDELGFYTFEDMMKAFRLGVLAECGDFPIYDYIGPEGVIKKYFRPSTKEEVV